MAAVENVDDQLLGEVTFSTQQDARDFLLDFVRQQGIANATYVGINLPVDGNRTGYVLTTYPEPWIERYRNEAYQLIDPVMIYGMDKTLPFDWTEVASEQPRVRSFFKEAAEYGVGIHGLSIPVRGAVGDRAMFSISSWLGAAKWEAFKGIALGNVMFVAYQFHQAVLRLESQETSLRPRLPPREVEVLRWAAAGKSVWDTAMILGLSERTVQFYLANVVKRLKAANKTHAVAEALRLSLL